MHFRDPAPVEDRASALRLDLARTLVGAPALPVKLPTSGLTLIDVTADRGGIDLLLGPTDPVARLRLTRDKAAPAVSVAVQEIQPGAARFRKVIDVLAERVQRATTAEKWDRAWVIAKDLAKLPIGVPLGFFRQLVAGVEPLQGLVRTGFNCNQDCGLCWQGRDWGRYGSDQVLTWIEDLREAGARSLLISGGEPTLDPDLARYLARARDLGFASITLETNAVQIAKPGVAARLFEAGLTTAFVSLHSGDAGVSDAITRAPGTHARTVLGIRALLEAGVPVILNAVLTAEGLDHLGRLPDFLHDAFGPHPLLKSLMISYPTDPFDRTLIPGIMPDPAILRAALKQAIDRSFELGITVRGLDGPCGPPLCAFDADPRITDLRPTPGPLDFRMHVPACDGCAVKAACFGVRCADVDRFGESCVSPIAAAKAS
ncbi:MAG: radical SAM protein [Minicystis sp.]